MKIRAPHAAVLMVCALAGCNSAYSAPDLSSDDAAAPASSTSATSATFVVPGVDSLVSTQRLANATPGDACTRLSTKAGLLKSKLSDPVLGKSAIPAAIQNVANDFGAFDGLLFGEVHRTQAVFTAAGHVSTTQIDLLVADLDHHLVAAGASADKVSALNAAILAFRGTAADQPATRMAASALVVDVADLLSDVQSCSPKS